MDNKDKNFEKKLVQNIEEKRAEQEYGAEIEEKLESGQVAETADREIPPESERRYHPMSEEEAKRMLTEDARQTEANLKDMNSDKHKKTIIAVVIVAVVLCLGMLILALVLGNRGESGEQIGDNGGNQVEEKPEEEPGEDKPVDNGIVEISVADERVRKVYDYFGILSGVDMFGFYSDAAVRNGIVDNKYLVGVAFGNMEHSVCKMEKTDENLMKRYAKQLADGMTLTDLAMAYDMGCYNGEELRKKSEEIFGKQANLEGEFPILGWVYSPEYDEVYSVPGMGSDGFGPGKGYLRGLYKAEESDSELLLYEVVAEIAGPGLICVDTGEYCEEEYEPTLENVVAHKEDFARYKWIFKKNTEGDYVFEKLERINN